jgi:sirohydrochlorin cobaltochelatase
MPSPLHGVILLGHGSREPGTENEIRELCVQMAAKSPDHRFAHAFLNQEPKLAAAVDELLAAGCAGIRVLPLLVFTGRHMIEDVPAEVARLRALHPTITIDLESHLFRLPGFRDLLLRALETPA